MAGTQASRKLSTRTHQDIGTADELQAMYKWSQSTATHSPGSVMRNLRNNAMEGWLEETKGNTPSSLRAGLDSALRRFRDSTTTVQLEEVRRCSLSDLHRVIIRIQEQQREQKQLMNLTRIQAFLNAMQQVEIVLGDFVIADDLGAFIWGPVKVLLQVCMFSLLIMVLAGGKLSKPARDA
jgi:hypothetical protein